MQVNQMFTGDHRLEAKSTQAKRPLLPNPQHVNTPEVKTQNPPPPHSNPLPSEGSLACASSEHFTPMRHHSCCLQVETKPEWLGGHVLHISAATQPPD